MPKLLVTGAAGHLGRAVIHHLLETEQVAPADLIAGSRDLSKLSDLAAKGVETRRVDFNDAEGLASAFAGVERVLLISTDDLATPGGRLKQHQAAVSAATSAGVRHLVYTSMPNPDRSLVSFAPDHLGTEKAIQQSGLAYTILRNAWYHDNYLMSMPHNLQVGKWFTAMGDGRITNISRDDCARAAAAALARPAAENRIFTLTGSRSLNAHEIASLVTEATGKPLEVVPVSDEQLAQGLAGAGLPDFVVKMLVSADANVRAGYFDLVTNDFNALTGREPQSLRDFLAAHRDALVAGH
ncbi:SDR family oxidoreductase [Rhizobium sp. NTR19]|uniref:SDR family oxidoreductase n=1 Tax=Neorhizobium turbinariae TaxID=2937795 RepID=A0ABT0IWX6_9HYPH|nr:SDR family oxidoreductase [Neorhizobium turbinariae]MCK8782392.1 SDR family oxidoreductase [Neorhizobium turbinariae]